MLQNDCSDCNGPKENKKTVFVCFCMFVPSFETPLKLQEKRAGSFCVISLLMFSFDFVDMLISVVEITFNCSAEKKKKSLLCGKTRCRPFKKTSIFVLFFWSQCKWWIDCFFFDKPLTLLKCWECRGALISNKMYLLARDTPSASPWLLEPVPPTPAPVCYDLNLSHSLAPAAKQLLSGRRRGSDTCLQRCTVLLFWREICTFPVLICRQCEW